MLVLFASAFLVSVGFAMGLGAFVYGIFIWCTRKNKWDVFSAVFGAVGGVGVMIAAGWAFVVLRDMIIRMGATI